MASAGTRVPKEGQDPHNAENIRLQKTATGTVHKQIGDSQFYSKHGIKPVADTLDNSVRSNSDLESPIKMKNVRKLHDGSTKFPKLAECAHFHYDFTEFGTIQVSLSQENQENLHKQGDEADCVFYMNVTSNERTWVIRRSYDNFKTFDKQLHKCIFDRKFSLLPDLKRNERDSGEDEKITALQKQFTLYLKRFSTIAGNMINCGPILSWLEMDNRGNRLMVTDDSAINTPAVSAGHVTKRYIAQASDEITLQVGDIISIIDMPHKEESGWWRGKREYEVGFFPSECIELISDKAIRESMESKLPESSTRPVLRKRGKFISRLRSLFKTRPTRTQLQRTGIVKQRIFSCDLGEHLLNSGLEVPLVLTMCTDVIEEHGIQDGIYRLSGVASNIQKLRIDFDDEKEPNLTDDIYLQDIHSISSLLKAYFRELPNPLLTYQLYEKFAAAVAIDEDKLIKIHDVIQQLPPPHYRTAEFLFKHLNRVSKHGRQTGMHCKNLAIVWAPNLMRSKELESMCNTAMLQGVGVQAIVTEYLIQYADIIFSDKLQNVPMEGSVGRRARPKSLAISTPTKLLSLEEAREQMLAGPSNDSPKQKYIEVGGGPLNLPKEFHTVIELPGKKKRPKKLHSAASVDSSTIPNPATGGSGWRNLFSRKKQDSLKSTSSETRVEMKLSDGDLSHRRKLRTVRSADSLLSAASSAEANSRISDPLDGRHAGFSKPKDEDFPEVQPKALTYERPVKTMYKSNRRTRSHDQAQSESDLSEHEEVHTMDTEVFPRPSSTDLTEQRPEFTAELGQTVAKSHSKKSKSSKDVKKSKKKQRSSSAGQPIEGIPMLTDEHDRMMRSMTSSLPQGESLTHFSVGPSHEVPPPKPQPPPSPSLKDRLVQALTPTSPRKKIKGPAPSPPSSPPPVVESTGKSKKKSSKSKSSKSSTTDANIQQHSKFELLTGKAVDNRPSSFPASTEQQFTHSHQYSTQQETELQQSQMVQLSPIEEALNSDMSITPDTEQHGLVAKLQHNTLQEIELQGAEGAEAEMASVGNLTDEEVFHQHYVITPDMENEVESRKDTLANLDVINSTANAQDFNSHESHFGYRGDNFSEQRIEQEEYNTLQSDTSGYTDSTLCNTDMSMSLDSLLKHVVGTDNYPSEFGSNTSFRTFGKTNESPRSKIEETGSNQNTSLLNSPERPQHFEYLTFETAGEDSYVHPQPPVPKPRASKSKNKRDKYEEKINTPDSDKCITTPTSSILETDLDNFDIDQVKTPVSDEVMPVEKDMFAVSEDEDREERRNYIAPLPGDIKMMSQYPDLIAPNLLAQIDLQESDVQYVDPHEMYDSSHPLHPPDVYLEAENKLNGTGNESKSETKNNVDVTSSGFGFPHNEDEYRGTASHQHERLPDLMPQVESPFGMKAESGRIVIRKPLENTGEGSKFIPVKTRVVPPPKQFAYSAPPVAADDGGAFNFVENVASDGETAIDTPSDEFPPPPPSIENCTNQMGSSDGYMADRSNSTSPSNIDRDHFQEKLKAISQPLTIDESEAMAISPVSSAKTPDSDVAMLTSSVESDNILDSINHSGIQVARKEQSNQNELKHNVDNSESEMVFQMDDVRSKSIDSLHNVSMSSEDADIVIQSANYEVEKKEFVIEDTQSQLDYYFTFENTKNEGQPETEQSKINEELSTANNMQSISIDTSVGYSDFSSAPSSKSPEAQRKIVNAHIFSVQAEENAKKSSPVKRKKSVKELLSKFEVVQNSPPSDGETTKVKPQVFQKPKIVRLHSLNKSDDFEDESVPLSASIITKSPRRDDALLMSTSCPEASHLLALSPRSINIEEEETPSYVQRSNTDIEPHEPTGINRNRPSVRNKIKQFESTESLSSDNERSTSLSPGRKLDVSPVGRAKPPVKERGFSPVPPAKPVIIHERKASKSDIPSLQGTETFELLAESFPQPQKSQLSPKFSAQEPVKTTSSFHMRSASSGNATNLFESDEGSSAMSQSLIERKRRFEGSKMDNSGKNNESSTLGKGTTQEQPSHPYRRPSVENSKAYGTAEVHYGTLERQKPSSSDHPVDYNRSASVPNTLEASEPSHMDYSSLSSSTMSQLDSSTVFEDEAGVLRPSQLFSRRSKRLSEPPPVPPHSHRKDSDSVVTSSFSDRRKLFEASTDSGIMSTSSYGSLKRSDLSTIPKQSGDIGSGAQYHYVEPQEPNYFQGNNSSFTKSLESQSSLASGYSTKGKNYGPKTIIIESKSSHHGKSQQQQETVSDLDSPSGEQSINKSKSYQREQKENVKPPIVFKSYEKDIGISPKERSGTVKDLWRKFEQQNT